jgi:hypothetical protein
MNFDYSTRIKVGIITLILFTLFSNIRLLFHQIISFKPKSIGEDYISLSEKRFTALKKALPPHGAVGYLTDVYPEKIAVNAMAMAGYYAARYSLAPIVIANTPEKKLVVGNFQNIKGYPQIYKKYGLVPVKNFNNGLFLLRREIQ